MLLLKSNPSRKHSKVLYCWGFGKRGKKNPRSGGFKIGLSIPRKDVGGSYSGWSQRNRPSDAEEKPREPELSKAGRTRDRGHIQDAFT